MPSLLCTFELVPPFPFLMYWNKEWGIKWLKKKRVSLVETIISLTNVFIVEKKRTKKLSLLCNFKLIMP